MYIIGREKEIKKLRQYADSRKSEFITVYGRRRVGKTYLIREVFSNQFSFQMTGLAKVGKLDQLRQFHANLSRLTKGHQELKPAKDWFEAFNQLIDYLEGIDGTGTTPSEKKIIFLDELPWLDTPKSKFLSALEYFWNSWASARRDILLIVCGSAASWMIKNLLNNKGGLHNRITARIKLEPFSLAETAAFLQDKGNRFDRYQVVLLYMVLGGIPFYLDQIETGLSAVQNINELCFARGALLRNEYNNLYASLFSGAERHMAVVEALAQKNKGLTRKEIDTISNLSNGGGLTRILTELEESSFIRHYQPFGRKERATLYQLIDPYSLFYFNFIQSSSPDDENFWLNTHQTPRYRAWSGYAFEIVCLHHIPQIKQALGITGVQTSVAAWHHPSAQVDLLIDRKDQVINLCEIKFAMSPYEITKSYADKLRNKMGTFQQHTKTSKALLLTLITAHGIVQNKHSYLAQNSITLVDLFK